MGRDDYQAAMQTFCRVHAIPPPEAEYRFDSKRKWRFDFCWPAAHVAMEINGGVYSRGRHTRGGGYIADMEKINASQLQHWRVMQYTPEQYYSGEWIPDIMFMLEEG